MLEIQNYKARKNKFKYGFILLLVLLFS